MATSTGIVLLRAGGGRSLLTYDTSGTLTESTSVSAIATPDPDNWGATGFLGSLSLTSSADLINPYITDATYPTFTIRARLDPQYIDTPISGTIRPKILDSQGIEGDTSGLINTTVNRVFQAGSSTSFSLGSSSEPSVGLTLNTNGFKSFLINSSNQISSLLSTYGNIFSDTSGSPWLYNDVKYDITGIGGSGSAFISTMQGDWSVGSNIVNDKSSGTYYPMKNPSFNQWTMLRVYGSGGSITVNFTVTFRNQVNNSKTFAQAFSLTFTKV